MESDADKQRPVPEIPLETIQRGGYSAPGLLAYVLLILIAMYVLLGCA